MRHLCPCFVHKSPKKCYKGLKEAHLRGTEVGRKWDFSISGTTSSKSRFLRLDGIAFPLKKNNNNRCSAHISAFGIHDKALMDSLSRRTMQCGFLLNTAWAYATLGIHNTSQPTTKALCQTPPISITGMCCEVQMAAMPDCGACLGRVARARGSAQICVTHGGTGLGTRVKAWPDGAPRPGWHCQTVPKLHKRGSKRNFYVRQCVVQSQQHCSI